MRQRSPSHTARFDRAALSIPEVCMHPLRRTVGPALVIAAAITACSSADTPTQPGPASVLSRSSTTAAATTIADLGLNAVFSLARGVNNRGQVVGNTFQRRDGEGPGRAFLWERGQVTDLGTLGGPVVAAEAFGVNDRGQVVGASSAAQATHAFLWERGTMRDLGTLGGDASEGAAINNEGQVVGDAFTATHDVHAFLWQNGTMTDLGTLGGVGSEATAINEQGQVVGGSVTTFEPFPGQPAQHAFLWQHGKMTDLGTLGGVGSFAWGINNQGQVVGVSDTPTSNGQLHAFLWQNGTMTDLGPEFRPRAINSQGQIVGADQEGHVVVWDRGRITQLPGLGGPFGFAFAISDRGEVAGYSGATSTHAVVWTLTGQPRP
jgi:probable HAF family extracellular repeat protein